MQIKTTMRDFLGGSVVVNPHTNAGDTGWIPGPRTKVSHAAGQISPCTTQLHATITEAHVL